MVEGQYQGLNLECRMCRERVLPLRANIPTSAICQVAELGETFTPFSTSEIFQYNTEGGDRKLSGTRLELRVKECQQLASTRNKV